jgi:hypothetical protein
VLTLRQISAVLSPDHAWLSRQVHVFQALPRLSPEAAKAHGAGRALYRYIEASQRL